MDAAQVNLQTVIPTTPEELFEFMTTPGQVRQVLPGLIESTNISEMPLKVGSTFDYKYKMYGVIVEGQWEVLELDAPTRYESKTTGGVDSTWKYAFESVDGGTQLTLALEYDAPESVLGEVKLGILTKINEKEASHFFDNLKAVFELRA